MKTSIYSALMFALLGAVSCAAADAEVGNALQSGMAVDADIEVERELQNRKKREAKRAAKRAKKLARKRARQEAKQAAGDDDWKPEPPSYSKPEPVHEPKSDSPKEMYKELIYAEKLCEDYREVPLDINQVGNANIQLGDTRSFKCELFETAIQYGQFGGRKVGDTFWYCRAFAFDSVNIVFTRQEFVVWDCTIVDYIGEDEEEDTTLRNEGLAVQIDRPDLNRDDAIWKEFHSHTGTFATVGGIIAAKGARGQVEVEWDDFRQTWYHVYTIEVWALEQTPILPFAIP
mmetsp:Transcript_14936/g.22080  ORF Transcript_14936/g.22080 Transcript_14936/m.22080 type:complete len:288 (-) Transcript_14936:231-1094(-)